MKTEKEIKEELENLYCRLIKVSGNDEWALALECDAKRDALRWVLED